MIDQTALAEALSLIPYAETLGVEPMMNGEELTLSMPFLQSNIGNPMLPALHGGGISGLMEIAAITQLYVESGQKNFAKPIGINVDYLRRGRAQDTFARAIIFKSGSRIANVHVRAWQDNYDKPIATMHGHYLIAKSG